MRRTLKAVSERGFLKVSERGFIAAVIERNPISPTWVIAKEFLWWGDADLIRSYRKWALYEGANEIQYSCPPEARAERLFANVAKRSEVIYSEYI